MESSHISNCLKRYNNCINYSDIIECNKEYNRCAANFLKLPVDVKVLLLSELSFDDVAKICLLITDSTCDRPKLWENLFQKDFKFSTQEIYKYYQKYGNNYNNLREYYLWFKNWLYLSNVEILNTAILKNREDLLLMVVKQMSPGDLRQYHDNLLRLVVDRGDTNMIRIVVDKYIELGIIDEISLSRYVVRAATKGNLNVVRLLLENYSQYMLPDMHIKDINLSLEISSFNQHEDVADYLISVGADPKRRKKTMIRI